MEILHLPIFLDYFLTLFSKNLKWSLKSIQDKDSAVLHEKLVNQKSCNTVLILDALYIKVQNITIVLPSSPRKKLFEEPRCIEI